MNKPSYYLKFSLLFILFSSLSAAIGQDLTEGEKLFKTNCKSCHSIGKGKVVGPDLKDVANRRSEEWLLKFIKNPEEMIASDAEAKKLFEEYDPVIMPNHSALSDLEIGSILNYIKTSSETPVVEAKPQTDAKETSPSETTTNKNPSKVDSVLTGIIFVLLGGCLVLVAMLIYLIFKLKNHD